MLTTTVAVLLLLATVTSGDEEEHIVRCGTPIVSEPGDLRRSGKDPDSVNPAESSTIRNHPWTVLLQYKLTNGGEREPCVGTLISDRHILTARVCVDAEGPNKRSAQLVQPHEITAYFGLMGPDGVYTANSVKALPNVDLAVIEIDQIELGDHARPICPEGNFTYVENVPTSTAYWKPRNGSAPGLELLGADTFDFSKCRKTYDLFNSYPYDVTDKDYLCIIKEKLICVEGFCAGAPVMLSHQNRWAQVGVLLAADVRHSVGLVIRVDVNAELIRNLTDCYLVGSGLDTVQTDDDEPGWHCKGEEPRTT